MKATIDLLNNISDRISNCLDKHEVHNLTVLGNRIADNLLAVGCDKSEIPFMFRKPHNSKVDKINLKSLKSDVKKLGGIDEYLNYYLTYIKNQPTTGFMNEPV